MSRPLSSGQPPSREHAAWTGGTALVTGATGFIGAHLVRRLAALGAEVHAVTRKPFTGPEAGPGGEPGERVIWHVAELRDGEAAHDLIGEVRPDVLFHLASEVDGAREVGLVLPTLDGNLLSTVNLLTAAAANPGIRLVLTGSSEEPRPGNGQSPPPSPYAMAKWAATGYAQLFQRLWDVPVTVLRPSMVYGPGQRDTRKLVPYVTLALLRGEEPRLTSGSKLADWVYVDDVIDAFVAAGRTDKGTGHILDVGTGTLVSVRHIVELLFGICGTSLRPRFGAIADRPMDVAQAADIGPIAEVLGWRPTVDLEEGLRRTVTWYAEQAGHVERR